MMKYVLLPFLFVAFSVAAGSAPGAAAPLTVGYSGSAYADLYAASPTTGHYVPGSLTSDVDGTAAYLGLAPVSKYTQTGIGTTKGITPETVSLVHGGSLSISYVGDQTQRLLGVLETALQYTFRLNGPSLGSTIPIIISGQFSRNADFNGGFLVSVSDPSSRQATTVRSDYTDTGLFSYTFDITPNAIDGFTLLA